MVAYFILQISDKSLSSKIFPLVVSGSHDFNDLDVAMIVDLIDLFYRLISYLASTQNPSKIFEMHWWLCYLLFLFQRNNLVCLAININNKQQLLTNSFVVFA